jgi:hypothetical protein
MADYYTYFSLILPLKPEQRDYALQLVNQALAHCDTAEPLPAGFPAELAAAREEWTFETKSTPEGLWLHSQYGGQESAGMFIQHLLQRFKFAPFVSFEWSHDCSKPRVDAYGGGAAFITAKKIKIFSTAAWLQKQEGTINHQTIN